VPSLLDRLGSLADDARKALLSVSAFADHTPAGGIDERNVVQIREALGGNLSPLPTTRTRWYLADLEGAVRASDVGDLSAVGQLWRSMRRDGTLAGLLSTRTDGLVRLPKRFFGAPEQVAELEPRNGTRSVFDEMFPPAELANLAADGVVCGVGIAELVPVTGRDFPVLRRLDPEFLRYRWNEGRWYYNSLAGPLVITPGDGQWVLHIPGGNVTPWVNGLWQPLGRSWINKEHALMHRANYGAKLANPARVAKAPIGATESQRVGFLSRVIAWGINTVFELPPGWDVTLLESNGRGYEVFQAEIDTSDKEMILALAGQTVTTDGGAGFANADIHKSIRADLIKATADGLAYTLNTQGLPPWVVQRWGIEALQTRALVEWDVEPAKDRLAEANSLIAIANAIGLLRTNLQPYGRDVDVVSIATRYGVPIAGDEDNDGTPDVQAPEEAVAPSPPVAAPAPDEVAA
jgi:hypothetical protein